MKKFFFRKGHWVVIAVLIILALIVYLNRSYAHIYNTIGRADLHSSDRLGVYLLSGPENNKLVNMVTTIASTTKTNSRVKPLVYSALGDSLTAGVGVNNYQESYPYLLATKLSASGRVIELHDRGIPGERSSGLITNLLPLAIKDQPDIVTLFIGINDIHGLISAQTFKKNYNTILEALSTKTTAKIYVINLPYLGAPNLILFPYTAILNWRTQEFNHIIKKLATQYSVHYIDLYTPTLVSFKKSGTLYGADSFHPSAAGYRLWANIIYARINQ